MISFLFPNFSSNHLKNKSVIIIQTVVRKWFKNTSFKKKFQSTLVSHYITITTREKVKNVFHYCSRFISLHTLNTASIYFPYARYKQFQVKDAKKIRLNNWKFFNFRDYSSLFVIHLSQYAFSSFFFFSIFPFLIFCNILMAWMNLRLLCLKNEWEIMEVSMSIYIIAFIFITPSRCRSGYHET